MTVTPAGPITAERFASGMTYEQFRGSMTRNRDRVEANEQRVRLAPEDRAAFGKLRKPLKVLVLAEDWCGDVVANLPVLARVAEDTGKLELRVFARDQNVDLMDQYLNQGKFRSIPVFAFFDEDLKPVGVFIERPASVTELRAKRRAEIFAAHPEFGSPDAPVDELPEDVRAALSAELQKMRDGMVEFANAEVIREIREIVERAA